MNEFMAIEKIDLPIRFNVSGSMWARIEAVLSQEGYTQSEYMRSLIRADLHRRDAEAVSRKLAQVETPEKS